MFFVCFFSTFVCILSVTFPFHLKPQEDTSVQKFEIKFSDEVLKDLKRRINNTRYFEGIEGVKFNYGFRPEYMKTVAKYWLDEYE